MAVTQTQDSAGGGFNTPERTVPSSTPPPLTTGSSELRLRTPQSESGDDQKRSAMIADAVRRPIPPEAYQGLQVGPRMTIEYEPNITPPIDGSQSLLRKLSPFMIQIEPPLVFGEDGGFLRTPKNSIIDIGTYDAAQGAASGYDASRSVLVKSGIGGVTAGFNGNPRSVGEFITPNASGPAKNSAPNATKQDSKGLSGDGRIGEPAIADLYVAVDIAWQLSVVLNTPPLVLLINPHTLTMTFNKIQQFQDRTRFGYVFHAWGEDQPKLTINAKCGGFVSGEKGYAFASKRDSAAWQNWMNLYHFYRNNGYIHDTVGKSFAHHHVGALSIHYDGWIYYGHMESFNYSYDESLQMGGMEFSIEFTVSAMVDTSKPVFNVQPMKSPIPSLSDPRYAGLLARGSNQQGHFSVNADGEIATQGRIVDAGEAFSVILPGENLRGKATGKVSASDIGRQGMATQPTGTKGFSTPFTEAQTPGQRSVVQSNPNLTEPFRVG